MESERSPAITLECAFDVRPTQTQVLSRLAHSTGSSNTTGSNEIKASDTTVAPQGKATDDGTRMFFEMLESPFAANGALSSWASRQNPGEANDVCKIRAREFCSGSSSLLRVFVIPFSPPDNNAFNEQIVEGSDEAAWTQHEGVLFVIDCTKGTHIPSVDPANNLDDEDISMAGGKKQSPFQLCMEVIPGWLKHKIIISETHLVGTEKAKNTLGFQNIYVLNGLYRTDVHRIIDCEKLSGQGGQ
ncbi:hypothetical protein BJ742DRAFT_901647 [Cladochytrium replicatum]|nr:hypothetical protein BJ742DRAFT_901647 [Cladochytrium replicatum]